MRVRILDIEGNMIDEDALNKILIDAVFVDSFKFGGRKYLYIFYSNKKEVSHA
jgi:hypothetical protein